MSRAQLQLKNKSKNDWPCSVQTQKQLIFLTAAVTITLMLQSEQVLQTSDPAILFESTQSQGNIVYLPTFSESNAWDFHLVMTEISGNVLVTSKDFQRISKDFQTLLKIKCPQMFRRCLGTSEAT